MGNNPYHGPIRHFPAQMAAANNRTMSYLRRQVSSWVRWTPGNLWIPASVSLRGMSFRLPVQDEGTWFLLRAYSVHMPMAYGPPPPPLLCPEMTG
jgi:hypothetical protein